MDSITILLWAVCLLWAVDIAFFTGLLAYGLREALKEAKKSE